ncbi:hypothetical protein APHAL10511_005874 [Amanita phalloides]|nr:hypothetical protein APHAL10511_005874 [Amanita phalloides]
MGSDYLRRSLSPNRSFDTVTSGEIPLLLDGLNFSINHRHTASNFSNWRINDRTSFYASHLPQSNSSWHLHGTFGSSRASDCNFEFPRLRHSPHPFYPRSASIRPSIRSFILFPPACIVRPPFSSDLDLIIANRTHLR